MSFGVGKNVGIGLGNGSNEPMDVVDYSVHKNGEICVSSACAGTSAGPLLLKSNRRFHEKLSEYRQWFISLNDTEKNVCIREILQMCGSAQIHMLSSLLEPRLHQYCPPNCQDPFAELPASVSLRILGYLDPKSLCRCGKVCRKWNQLCNDPQLWKRICMTSSRYRLASPAVEAIQINRFLTKDGTVMWKDAFSERFRLYRNWTQGRCVVRTFEGHSQGISCVQFDENRIVSGSSDNTIKVWDIRTNNRLAVLTLTGHSDTVRCLQLMGNRVISGSNDTTIKLWDVSNGSTWSSITCRTTMVGHTESVRCLQMAPDKVLSGSYDRTIKVWDLPSGALRSTLQGHNDAVLCLQFDERKLISGSADTSIKVWDLRNDECVMTLQNVHQAAVTCLQFDENRIVSGSLDCSIKFFDVRTGAWIHTLDWRVNRGHTGVVRCLQMDTWRICSGADDRTIKIWDFSGDELQTLQSHSDGVTCLYFNDQRIVSGSYDKTVKLFDFSIG